MNSQTVIGTKDNTKVVFKIGNTQSLVNGETKTFVSAAVIIGGTTFLPVRFTFESFGA